MKLMRASVTALTLLATAACGDDAAGEAQPQATVTVTETATPSESPTETPTEELSDTATQESVFDGVTIAIVCFDKRYNEHWYSSPEAAWPDEYDYCDSPTMQGSPSAREQKASEVAYGTPRSDRRLLSNISVLYDMCAAAHPKSYDYLRTAGSPGQIKEIRGMLILCPDHPLRRTIESYVGEAEDRNRLEADGRIFYDGTYRVGPRIKPGTYFARPAAGDSCYWERTDRSGNIIDNNISTALRMEVSILASDYSFTSEGCGKWEPVQ